MINDPLKFDKSAPESSGMLFMRLVGRYWTGQMGWTAWLLTGLLLILVLASVRLQSLINSWNASFFNALEAKDQAAIAPLLWMFGGYVVAAGLIMVVTVLVRMTLQVQVREYVTTAIYGHWLKSRSYLRLDRNAKGAETPEFRIADDVRMALEQLIDLAVGFFTSVLLAITFFEVLARVGGSIQLGANGPNLPVYFLFAAVGYACLMSGFSSLVGWPLIGRIQRKNHLEGVFRYELMRVREDAQVIASTGREPHQAGLLAKAMGEVTGQWRRVLVGQSQVLGVASSNAVLVGVFPVVIAIPKYMSGEMSLGAVIQVATAFVQVQMALNWIVDNYMRFAELRASAIRVGDLVRAMNGLEPWQGEQRHAGHPDAPAGVEPGIRAGVGVQSEPSG